MAQTLTFSRIDAHATPRFSVVVSEWLHTWAKDIFDPYRPERHYMRGPGPKWYAKHGMPVSRVGGDMPELTRLAA